MISNEITRENVLKRSDTIFVFGDNLAESGYGGQAKELRGLPNAYGVPTKKFPSMNKNAFFTDEEFEQNKDAIERSINKIPIDCKDIVVLPLGVGRAELYLRAPKTFDYLIDRMRTLVECTFTSPIKEKSKAENECWSLALRIGGAVVTSKRGVPHVIKRIGFKVYSACYFTREDSWKVFHPYGFENQVVDNFKTITEIAYYLAKEATTAFKKGHSYGN
jgi:hypothetical protein